jgi:hypothetical protein
LTLRVRQEVIQNPREALAIWEEEQSLYQYTATFFFMAEQSQCLGFRTIDALGDAPAQARTLNARVGIQYSPRVIGGFDGSLIVAEVDQYLGLLRVCFSMARLNGNGTVEEREGL